MDRKEIFECLEGSSISKVEIQFSGGGDEGHVDCISVYDTDGRQLLNDDPRMPFLNDSAFDGYLSDPIYDEYGGFAGDFYVHGVLTWDVVNKKVLMNGNEEDRTYVPFEKEL